MIKKAYKVQGMDCASCASLIEMDLEDIGIKASCSYPRETLVVEYENNSDEAKVKEVVSKSGYSLK